MAQLAQLSSILILSVSSVHAVLLHFEPPDAVLQAGYPAGFRAFIPDFPGCEKFAFHGKLNSPFGDDNEAGTWGKDILRPHDGFWTFEDTNSVLTPGDVLHYWTLVVKDKVPYPRRNLTWTVPSDPNDSVDFITPSTVTNAPKPTPLKMVDIEEIITENTSEEPMKDSSPTLPEILATGQELAGNTSRSAQATTTTTAANPSDTSLDATTSDKASSTPSTSDPKSSDTTVPDETSKVAKAIASTTEGPAPPTEVSRTIQPLTPTTKKSQPTEKLKSTKNKKSALPMVSPLVSEDVEELTTPAFEKPLASTEFPQEPPLFPFPSLFPQPFKPPVSAVAPGFDICSNPWTFEEQLGESRTQRLEKQVARLQCQFAMFQRGTVQLGNTVENELTDLKKLIYGMVSRMTRLETLIRSAAFG